MILGPVTAACIAAAATAYQIPADTMFAIQRVEGGASGVAHHNSNGTYDFGTFQINSTWLPSLEAYFGFADLDATRRAVRDDDCTNARAAAAILLFYWREAGRLDVAVAYYHSHTPPLGRDYFARVNRAQAALMAREGARR